MKHRRGTRNTWAMRWRWKMECAVFSALLRVLGWLGRRGPRLLNRFAGAVGKLVPIRRAILHDNFRIAFGELEPARERTLRAATCAHTAQFIGEMARLARIAPAQIPNEITIDPADLQTMSDLVAEGRGVLLASGHLGNWEWLGAALAQRLGNVWVVYKPMHNPYTDALLRKLRERIGMQVISTSERVPRGLLHALRSGGCVAILSDQDARREGDYLPFFGRLASTAMGLADMAVRLNVPVVIGAARRDRDGRLRFVMRAPLRPDPAADRAGERRRIMLAYHAALEEWIRETPGQYFWWHRRWKTRPRQRDLLRLGLTRDC